MSEINLFKINSNKNFEELVATQVELERELQSIIEKNMELFFGIRFLKSEMSTTNGGRIDSIGIDENSSPVIFEYKRSSRENIINQGLFYLDWLLDHKESFQLLVQEKYGVEYSKNIDWSSPSVMCIAADFTKYDLHAVNQMQKNIRLIKYKKFPDDLLLFEYLNTPIVAKNNSKISIEKKKKNISDKTIAEKYQAAPEKIQLLFDTAKDFILSLGDDITETELKLYIAFKKVKNIVCMEIFKKHVAIYLKIDLSKLKFEEGFTRDVTNIGHYGTGNLEIIIKNQEDLEKAKYLIEQSYNEN